MDKPVIKVDRDGRWYYRGSEIVRREVIEVFWRALERNQQGRYYLKMGDEQEPVEVEDTVFLVQWAELRKEPEEHFQIRLNDGTEERLDLSTFWIDQKGVPYCLVKGGRFPARFLRLPFYQVAQHASFDQERGEYFVELNGRRFPLGRS